MKAFMRKRERGQSLVEFALVMPILIALLVVIMILALVGFSYVSINSAARMGTRHMYSHPEEPEDPVRFDNVDQEITWVVTTAMPFMDWTRATITILPQPPEDRLTPDFSTILIVRISYPMDLPHVYVPFIVTPGGFDLIPPITLNAESRMPLDR